MVLSSKGRVAVIGAGPCGLTAARALQVAMLQGKNERKCVNGNNDNDNDRNERRNSSYSFRIIEKSSGIGGLWRNGMYKNLRTIIPMELMVYRELPWTDEYISDTIANSCLKESFPSHHIVYKYLQEYVNKFHLSEYVDLNTEVIDLRFDFQHKSYFSPKTETWPKIRVRTKTMCYTDDGDGKVEQSFQTVEEHEEQEELYDAVMVANGHYAKAFLPTISGLMEYHRGTIIHSMDYKSPEDLLRTSTTMMIDNSRNEFRVLVIGAGASGTDIAREISQYQHADVDDDVYDDYHQQRSNFHVTLIEPGIGPKTTLEDGPRRVHNLSWYSSKVERFLHDGSVFLSCGSTLEPFDVVLCCTGYLYDYPFFLSEKEGNDVTDNNIKLSDDRMINNHKNVSDDGDVIHHLNSNLWIDGSKKLVGPLYHQLWHAKYPNLAFLGIPFLTLPFPMAEFQAQAVVSQWCNFQLPAPDERMKETMTLKTHCLGDLQWDYYRQLSSWTRSKGKNSNHDDDDDDGDDEDEDDIESFIQTSQAMWDHTYLQRQGGIPGENDDYRLFHYQRNDAQKSFTVLPKKKDS